MALTYKNPISSVEVSAPSGVGLTSTYGSTFSTSLVGGYQEVWRLTDLDFSTFGATGNISNSGNTIPVTFYKSPVSTITNRITLNSDGISSGRRKLGMLVYVHENQTTYQFQIDNYETLWDNAVTDNCITSTDISYTVSNRVGGVEKASGAALISAWTGSTIENVSGTTRENAKWRIFYGSDVQITGGTHSNGTTTLYNNTGGTITITGYTNSSSDYIAINSVPASISISDFVVNNSMRDAYVVIPSDYNNKTITSVNGSYGDVTSSTDTTFLLEMRNSSNTVTSSVSWVHTGGSRNFSYTFPTSLTLTSGNTLNINYSGGGPEIGSKGYSATFEVTL